MKFLVFELVISRKSSYVRASVRIKINWACQLWSIQLNLMKACSWIKSTQTAFLGLNFAKFILLSFWTLNFQKSLASHLSFQILINKPKCLWRCSNQPQARWRLVSQHFVRIPSGQAGASFVFEKSQKEVKSNILIGQVPYCDSRLEAERLRYTSSLWPGWKKIVVL